MFVEVGLEKLDTLLQVVSLPLGKEVELLWSHMKQLVKLFAR